MVKILHKKLMQLSRRAREEFDYVFDQKMRALDSKTLWRAAKELNGPVSDVGFEYFRAWVIAQGRQVYEQALNNADSILIFKGKRKAGDYELEELLTVTQS
jgi:capsule polysaccharide modification protein KpsS